MVENKIASFLDTNNLLKVLTELTGYQVDKDEIAISLYSIFLDHEDDAENFINGKFLIDGVPYKQSTHGDLRNVTRRFLRNSESFQFEDAFIDLLWDRGNK